MSLALLAAACTVRNPTAKELTSLVFFASNNPGLPRDVTAVIDGTTAKATVPFGRNRSLVATFATTGARVEVDGVAQESGVTSNDFMAPVVYRVFADNGSTQDYTVTAATPVQQAYGKASNSDAGDAFGDCLAISADGTTLAVGATNEASAAKGINGNQDDNSALDSGAVYVFTRSDTGWSQQAYIKASNSDADDRFGIAALSADGNTLAISANGESSAVTGIGGTQSDNAAPGSGAVYVFTRSGTTWSQQAYIKASNSNPSDFFGASVAISADGNTLVVGAAGEASNATGVNGNQGDNSVVGSGAVYVFTRSGTAWSQQAYIKASNTDAADFFGLQIALTADGNTLAVGSQDEDSNAKGVNGNQSDNSAKNSGAVYVFTRSGAMWTQQAYIKASNTDAGDHFGNTVAISADGTTLAVGAPNESSAAKGISGNQDDNSAPSSGAVYVFTRSGTGWNQQTYMKASNSDGGDNFGASAAFSTDGNTLSIGATEEDSAATGIGGNQDDNSTKDSGAVYLFTRSDTVWSQQGYIKASNTDAGDNFGAPVALSGDGVTLAVASFYESSAGRGVNDNNNQSDNSKPRSGAVYVFQ